MATPPKRIADEVDIEETARFMDEFRGPLLARQMLELILSDEVAKDEANVSAAQLLELRRWGIELALGGISPSEHNNSVAEIDPLAVLVPRRHLFALAAGLGKFIASDADTTLEKALGLTGAKTAVNARGKDNRMKRLAQIVKELEITDKLASHKFASERFGGEPISSLRAAKRVKKMADPDDDLPDEGTMAKYFDRRFKYYLSLSKRLTNR